MKRAVIYAGDYDSMEEVHDYLAETLEFPSYYGKNLSALYDVLTDADEPTYIEMDYEGVKNSQLLHELERMAEVITDATAENGYLELTIIEP